VRKRRGAAASRVPSDCSLLYGLHTVRSVLLNPRRVVHGIYVTQKTYKCLQDWKIDPPVEPRFVETSWFDASLGSGAVHQGLAVAVEPLEPGYIDELNSDTLVLALDSITDPHNVGAIFRSAAAFGATAIITTSSHSPRETGVLAKAASGTTELVKRIEVSNLSLALRELKSCQFSIIGLDSQGDIPLEQVPPLEKCVLVLGAEGRGIKPINRKQCCRLARIDLPGPVKSLNVSNATALSLYIVTHQILGV